MIENLPSEDQAIVDMIVRFAALELAPGRKPSTRPGSLFPAICRN